MSDICQDMDDLSSSRLLITTLIVTSIICVMLIIMAIYSTYRIWFIKSSKLFHYNVLVIIQFHIFGFFIHCSARLVLHLMDIYNYFYREPCDMIPNVWRCFILRLIYAIGLWITSTTVIPLVIERFIATKISSKYENDYKYISYFLVLFQSVIVYFHLSILYSGSTIEGVVLSYCMVARTSTVNVGDINGYITMAVQVLARIAFQYLYYINRNLRGSQLESSLSNRYQLEQNLNVMRILKVFANLSSIYLFLHAISFMLILDLKNYVTKPQYYALVEINSSYPIYGIVSILIMWQMLRKVS